MIDRKYGAENGGALAALVAQIGALFSRAHAIGGEPPAWSEFEQVLTDGYALALDLEAERWRIERRMSELVSAPAERDAKAQGRTLRARHAGLEGDIRWLRSLLEELQEYGSRFRQSEAPAVPRTAPRYGPTTNRPDTQ